VKTSKDTFAALVEACEGIQSEEEREEAQRRVLRKRLERLQEKEEEG